MWPHWATGQDLINGSQDDRPMSVFVATQRQKTCFRFLQIRANRAVWGHWHISSLYWICSFRPYILHLPRDRQVVSSVMIIHIHEVSHLFAVFISRKSNMNVWTAATYFYYTDDKWPWNRRKMKWHVRHWRYHVCKVWLPWRAARRETFLYCMFLSKTVSRSHNR